MTTLLEGSMLCLRILLQADGTHPSSHRSATSELYNELRSSRQAGHCLFPAGTSGCSAGLSSICSDGSFRLVVSSKHSSVVMSDIVMPDVGLRPTRSLTAFPIASRCCGVALSPFDVPAASRKIIFFNSSTWCHCHRERCKGQGVYVTNISDYV